MYVFVCILWYSNIAVYLFIYLYEKFYVRREALSASTEVLRMEKPSASLEIVQGLEDLSCSENSLATVVIFKVILFSHS